MSATVRHVAGTSISGGDDGDGGGQFMEVHPMAPSPLRPISMVKQLNW